MIILGVDPGTAITGYGIVQSDGAELTALAYGAITTPADWQMPKRLQQLYHALTALIAEQSPTEMAVEKLFFNKNVRTALSVGRARGVALLAGTQADLAIYEYTPLQVKQAVVGYGRADKNQIQQMVKLLLQLDAIPQPDDAADALAVAICHAHTAKFNDMTSDK